nr:selenite/tellurite reduction operon rhodanese-like protein ExtH [uncultured Desulfuromonas sp.]
MIRKVFKHTKDNVVLFAAVVLSCFILTACGGGGGGSDSYDEPKTVTNDPVEDLANTSVLITPEILKGWMDAGLVNNEDSFNGRVVILSLEATSETVTGEVVTEAYPSTHIPGAFPWGSVQAQTRLDGFSEVTNMVVDGPTMDAILERCGIDENTTIVLTYAGSGVMSATRDYGYLRYWGFPKEKIKVLNGGDNAWADAGYELTDAPATAATTYMSVSDNEAIRTDLYMSLAEMILAVQDNDDSGNTLYNIVDTRGASATYINNAIPLAYSLFTDRAVFFPKADAVAAIEATDFDPTLPSITYCVSGGRASVGFFVLDAIMGYDVAVYDGSWNQWGLYTDPYQVDSDGVVTQYNLNDLWSVESLTTGTMTPVSGTINADLNATLNDLEAPEATQIETEDTEYFNGGASSGATGPGEAGEAAGC